MAFTTLRPPQTRSAQISAQIEQRVRTGELMPGTQLPTEAQLAIQFGVSRNAVREALKALEAMGLVTSHQGRGSFVRESSAPAVSRVLDLSVATDESSVGELFDFRELLEAGAARQAAERRSTAQVKQLEELVAANAAAASSGDASAFHDSDVELHRAICDATGNRYLSVVLAAVREMQHEVVERIAKDPGSVRRAVRQHRTIVGHIAASNPDTAEGATRAHVRSTAASVRRHRLEA